MTILLANLVIACMLYERAGWHYIRGYQEVLNFLIYPVMFRRRLERRAPIAS